MRGVFVFAEGWPVFPDHLITWPSVWVTFSGILLCSIAISVCSPVLHCLRYWSFIPSFEISCILPFQTSLYILGPLFFHTDFRISLSTSTKKDCWDFGWDCSSVWFIVGRTDIFVFNWWTWDISLFSFPFISLISVFSS